MKNERAREQGLDSINWKRIITDIYIEKRNYHADLVLRETDTFSADRNFMHEAI